MEKVKNSKCGLVVGSKELKIIDNSIVIKIPFEVFVAYLIML